MNLIKNSQNEPNPEQYTILVIDDNATNVAVIVEYLQEHGFKTPSARTGNNGLKRARRILPDLILLDVMMPDMNGFTVCEYLKNDETTRDIPVIFMTALASVEDKIKGFAVGAVDYVTKPIQHEEVLARVTTHLRLLSLTRNLQQQTEFLSRQTTQLEISSQVAQQVSSILNLDILLAGIVNSIQAKFGFYHAQFYLLDEAQENLVLAEGTGAVGVEMKAQEYHLPLDTSNNLAVQAAQSGKIAYAVNVQETKAFLPHPLLPNTQVEMAVPIIIDGQVMGILDVQEDRLGSLTESDGKLMHALANQVAVAIRNANLFEQTVQAKQIAEAAQEKAEMANRAKSNFLANMSHELRTPLNGILGYAQILKRNGELTSFQLDGLNVIQDSGEYLLTLINDILDLAKIEAQKMELAPAYIQLPIFLDNIAVIFSLQAREKNLAFIYEAAPSLPHSVQVDEKRLRQILLNLLGNAVKFTQTGEVALRVYEPADPEPADPEPSDPKETYKRLRFEVTDTGIGIAPKQLAKMFLPFEQADQRGNVEGTGLGLTISLKLAQLMGSQIQVKSQLGQGSTFWFDVSLLLGHTLTEIIFEPPRNIIGYQGEQQIIMVVDDKPYNRSVFVELLKPLGFNMIEAKNGQEAVEQFQTCQPDLIFMDLIMPVMGGFEATQSIRQLTSTGKSKGAPVSKLKAETAPTSLIKKPVIIASSASIFKINKKKSELVGCDDFIGKPVQVDLLFDLLQKHLTLEWIYNMEQVLPEPSKPTTNLVIPPAEELDILLDLARSGRLSRIKKQATYLAKLDDSYIPFANQLQELAKGFQEKAILALLTGVQK